MKIKLSKIPEWWKMSSVDVVNYMNENGYKTLINDYGFGLEFNRAEVIEIWKYIMNFKVQAFAKLN